MKESGGVKTSVPGMPERMKQGKGAANEIYKIGKFRFESIPYLYGMHGVWRCGKRAAFMDA